MSTITTGRTHKRRKEIGIYGNHRHSSRNYSGVPYINFECPICHWKYSVQWETTRDMSCDHCKQDIPADNWLIEWTEIEILSKAEIQVALARIELERAKDTERTAAREYLEVNTKFYEPGYSRLTYQDVVAAARKQEQAHAARVEAENTLYTLQAGLEPEMVGADTRPLDEIF